MLKRYCFDFVFVSTLHNVARVSVIGNAMTSIGDFHIRLNRMVFSDGVSCDDRILSSGTLCNLDAFMDAMKLDNDSLRKSIKGNRLEKYNLAWHRFGI